jgi:hypothetical protein
VRCAALRNLFPAVAAGRKRRGGRTARARAPASSSSASRRRRQSGPVVAVPTKPGEGQHARSWDTTNGFVAAERRSWRRCGTGEPGRLAQIWQRRAKTWCRSGRGEPSAGADGAGASPVPLQMWQGRAQSRCRCGRGGPSPGADVAGLGPVPVQMWQGRAQSRCRCGSGCEPLPSTAGP